ncbi:MAG: hypothetical protein ACLS3F_03510 [Oscillospiraceae bacterium]
MITSVYAHILDEDRKINAQKFESAFYANPDLRSVRPRKNQVNRLPPHWDLEALGGTATRKSPELANTLAALLAFGPIRKIGRENRISKSAFFISKAGKIVLKPISRHTAENV